MGKSILKFPNFDINMTKFGCSLQLIPHIYTVPFYLHCLLAFVHDLLTCRLSIRAKSHSGHNAYTAQAQADHTVLHQGCGSGSTWIRIHFSSWIRIRIQEGKFVN